MRMAPPSTRRVAASIMIHDLGDRRSWRGGVGLRRQGQSLGRVKGCGMGALNVLNDFA